MKLEAYAPAPETAKALSPTELLASLRQALAPWKPGSPFWIFAYGSLMWNPSFAWDARHVAVVRGYHRSFRLWSRLNRGTPENPGLVLTLDRGGSCRGLVYRIPADRVHEEMHGIWKREMTFGSRSGPTGPNASRHGFRYPRSTRGLVSSRTPRLCRPR